nr:hypothetical protein TetV2_00519 [Oceanusvirus sp.]
MDDAKVCEYELALREAEDARALVRDGEEKIRENCSAIERLLCANEMIRTLVENSQCAVRNADDRLKGMREENPDTEKEAERRSEDRLAKERRTLETREKTSTLRKLQHELCELRSAAARIPLAEEALEGFKEINPDAVEAQAQAQTQATADRSSLARKRREKTLDDLMEERGMLP